MAEYEFCILGLKLALAMGVRELLVIGDSDLLIHQHPDQSYIDPLKINLKEKPTHYAYVEEDPDGKPWYYDIKRYSESGIYPERASNNQKKTIWHLAKNNFTSGEILFRRTPDLGFLRCVDVAEANKLIKEVHARVCGAHMNGFPLLERS
ncbi:uncharacterized protein LOC124898535 [Capsicum annuum]|uniref:uncharacterized protein LOC124898535 n=1 Tax=Capsicum annuum TaxID=4072 RepID=UPI001FB06661|nr:uncharacterized protein LOC124898535 [Capsicum annuum]